VYDGSNGFVRQSGSTIISNTDFGSSTIDGNTIGTAGSEGTGQFNDIAEFAVWDEAKTGADLTEVENYLSNKWGL